MGVAFFHANTLKKRHQGLLIMDDYLAGLKKDVIPNSKLQNEKEVISVFLQLENV